MTNEPKKPAAGFGTTSSALAAHTPKPNPPAPPLTLGAILFSCVIFGVPVAQAVYEKARDEKVQALDYLDPVVHGASQCWRAANDAPPSAWQKFWWKVSPPHHGD